MYPQYTIIWAESPDHSLYLRINQTQTVRDHFTMPVKFFAFHGNQIDTITCENNLRSQGFQKSLGYVIDSLKFDDDALILSTDTMIYSTSLLPNAVRTGNPMQSAFEVYRDGSELLCTFSSTDQNGILELYNSLGMKIQSVTVSSGETSKKLDIRNLSSGIYFVRLGSEVRSVSILH